jgi:hypothetical protein
LGASKASSPIAMAFLITAPRQDRNFPARKAEEAIHHVTD